MAKNEFLGRGWSFPPTFDKKRQGLDMLEAEEDIHSSLHILLNTQLGERVLQPKFGCALSEILFESLTTTMKTYIKDLIETSILYHEPRIEVTRIEFETSDNDGKINIDIEYKVRSTNSRYNFVYPFYLNEAS